MGGACSTHGRDEKCIKFLVKKPEGKRPLRRPRKDRMDLGEIGWEGVDWMHLAQDRDVLQGLVYTVMNFEVP
jgi:hypothetical protein